MSPATKINHRTYFTGWCGAHGERDVARDPAGAGPELNFGGGGGQNINNIKFCTCSQNVALESEPLFVIYTLLNNNVFKV